MTRSTFFLSAISATIVSATGLPMSVAGQRTPTGVADVRNDVAAAIDRIVEAPIKAGKVAGTSVAVTRRGETIVAKSYQNLRRLRGHTRSDLVVESTDYRFFSR